MIQFRAGALALLATFLVVASARAQEAQEAQQTEDDPAIAAYRERFKSGLERYKAGDVAQAIQYWEPLFRDLGPQKGYRVAYDLARAYETFGDATRAAERFEVFVAEASARSSRGELSDELVLRESADAQERLEGLKRNRARISVPATTPPSSVAIDATEPRIAGFVAYVAPGPHTVVFDPGSNDVQTREVRVNVGDLVEVSKDTVPIVAPLPLPPPPISTRPAVVHPFSPAWLFLAGSATLASGLVPYFAYAHANDLNTRYSPPHAATATEQSSYQSARTWAYASWLAPTILGLATVGLAIWYGVKTKTILVPVVTDKEAGLSFGGRF